MKLNNDELCFKTEGMINAAMDKAPHDWLKNVEALLDAQRVWRDGTYKDEVFAQYFVTTNTDFQICCGVGLLAAHVRKFRFSPKVIATLGRLIDQAGRPVFEESFLNHLQRLSLRIELSMPLEGMLLLPHQPVGIMRGNKLQVLLLKSALEELVGRSTYWASQAAMTRWAKKDLVENDTPAAPILPANRSGWKMRAEYIGGIGVLEPSGIDTMIHSELKMYPLSKRGTEIGQIRRLFDGNKPLFDIEMTEIEDNASSVSKVQTQLKDQHGVVHSLEYSRFIKLYQPVLVKGHPVLASPQLAIRRQRTLHQMLAFAECGLQGYGIGKELI
jgi:hypothetical protein